MCWYRDVCRASATTGDIYLRCLEYYFCKNVGKDSSQLVKIEGHAICQSDHRLCYIDGTQGEIWRYITSVVKVIKSWLAFNGIKLPRRIKMVEVVDTSTLDGIEIFNQDDLRKVLDEFCQTLFPHYIRFVQ